MKIVESLYTTLNVNDKEMRYTYRILSSNLKNEQAYGIEIERQDVVDMKVVKVERDSVDYITNDLDKVSQLLNLLYRNIVSPIHLIEIIGEYVDEYVSDFNALDNLEVSL